MPLSDGEIRKAVREERIRIEPFVDDHVQPASVDLTLGQNFIEFAPEITDTIDPLVPREESEYRRYPADVMCLWPGTFVLASTVECITIPNDITARLEGKSSLARIGLLVHVSAGFVDPGWSGQLTLEIFNFAPRPILLHAGMKIAQIAFLPMSAPARHPYGSNGLGSKYQHSQGVVPSKG